MYGEVSGTEHHPGPSGRETSMESTLKEANLFRASASV